MDTHMNKEFAEKNFQTALKVALEYYEKKSNENATPEKDKTLKKHINRVSNFAKLAGREYFKSEHPSLTNYVKYLLKMENQKVVY